MVQLERVCVAYSNESSKYLLTKTDRADAFQRQYYGVYSARLDLLRPRIVEAAKQQFGDEVIYKQLENLDLHEKALVIGTIEKRISQRPSILKELAEEHILADDFDVEGSLVSSKDFLEFEDEKQIVKLDGNITMDEVATGCTVGLFGSQVKDDLFLVENIIWPSPPLQRPWPSKGSGALLAFISGIELTGDPTNDASSVLPFSLFSRWLTGEMAMSDEDRSVAVCIDRVVIAGESIAVGQAREFASAVRYLTLTRQEATSSLGSITALDELLSKITSKMCVDLMPGLGDPATQQLPQQPIHRACLPRASINGAALGLVPNPYEFSLEGLDFIVTSGQNISDLRRLSGVSSGCDLLELLLKWQHLSPTCPDTVDGFPFVGRDPLVIDKYFPHIMVVGNQPRAESRWLENNGRRTLLLSLPKFSRTHMVTLLNLNNMEVSYRYFGV